MENFKNNEAMDQLKKGTFDLVILLILRKEDSYGYEIVKKINGLSFYTISQSGIYPILKRLLKEELIIFYWKEGKDKPPRKYYQITEKGVVFSENQLKNYKEIFNAITNLEKELE